MITLGIRNPCGESFLKIVRKILSGEHHLSFVADVGSLRKKYLSDQSQICKDVGEQQKPEGKPWGKRNFIFSAEGGDSFIERKDAEKKQAGKADQHQGRGSAVK